MVVACAAMLMPRHSAADAPLPLADNLVVRAAVAGERFQVEKEGTFQVYLESTLPRPLSDVRLKVDSDQFDATVAPSPSWKSYPELPAAAEGGAKGSFSVSLRRKAGSAGGDPDIALRVYAACGGARFLAATLTLAEALDEHRLPFISPLNLDGHPSPQFWANATVLTDFIACGNRAGYLAGYKSTRPGSTNQTRVYLAADDEHLNLLIATVGYSGSWIPADTQIKIFIAPVRDGHPFVLAVNELTFQMTCTPALEGAKCVRCPPAPFMKTGGCDAIIYQVEIPRKAVVIEGNACYMNFCRTMSRDGKGTEAAVLGVRPPGVETACWRGNERSVEDPAVYGKMILPSVKSTGR
jgi:hypothetical protein